MGMELVLHRSCEGISHPTPNPGEFLFPWIPAGLSIPADLGAPISAGMHLFVVLCSGCVKLFSKARMK